MPFGFDQNEAGRQFENYDGYERHYVAVTAKMKKDGKIIPVSFLWNDGAEYKIDKIVDIRQGRSLKYKTSGFRYLCLIDKKEFYLYYTGEKWYVEARMPI